jgi:hypothetical protein
LIAIGACSSKPAPWDESTSGKPRFDAKQDGPPPAPEPSASTVVEGRLESGGIFATCSQGLKVTADALRDVARLGLSCGPIAGMKRITDAPFEGALSLGGADLEFPIELEKGRCYRLFVASETAGPELSIEVATSHDLPVASEKVLGGLGAVPAERPLCALGDDRAVVRIAMRCPPSEGPNGPCPRNGVRFALDVYAR